VRGQHLRRGGEVDGERRVGLDGDDPVVLGPYLREQREQELGSLGGLVLGAPEAREVFEDCLGAVEIGVCVVFARCSSASKSWRCTTYLGSAISPMM
jgi:hypothetical protein